MADLSAYIASDPSQIKISQLFLVKASKKVIELKDLNGATTIAEVKQRMADKDGDAWRADGVMLMFGGKQLSDDKKTLSDYGVKNRSNIFIVFRVLGGAEGPRRIPKTVTRWPKGLSASTEECSVLLMPPEPDAVHAKMNCGHVFSACGMLAQIESSVMLNGDGAMRCPTSGCGREFVWPSCLWVAQATEEEEKRFDKQYTENRLITANPNMTTCPNPECGAYCFKPAHITDLKVQCAVCRKPDWCWSCKHEWVNPSSRKQCLRQDCDYSAQIVKLLENCRTATISGVANVPVTRLCPKCQTVVQWKSGCKHVDCPNTSCRHGFCMSCLRPWKELGGDAHLNHTAPDKCPVKGVQKLRLVG